MAVPLATLTTSGWMSTPQEIAPKLMQYYFASEHSQSNAYLGSVRSLSHTLSTVKRNYVYLEDQVRNDLTTLFNSHFERADVQVKVAPVTGTDNDGDQYSLTISIAITDKGKTYSLSRLVSVVNNQISAVSQPGE